MDKLSVLKAMVASSSKIVFFGGAGVSTESGIPDFRSESGLYNAVRQYGYSPEDILSHSFFMHKPEVFFEYYRQNLVLKGVEPNRAHYALAKLEQQGKLTAVITQNIDGLHTLAGSKSVYELHGTIYKNHCMRCGKAFALNDIDPGQKVPKCSCGGTIKPDVVLYEEGLEEAVIMGAIGHISRADMLIVGGTSLAVYPANTLIDYYCGNKLVLINKSTTPYDNRADLVINDSIGKILSLAVEGLDDR